MRIACVALAGTIGAMGMLGHRRGGITEMFAAGGHLLAPGLSRPGAVLGGLLVHMGWMAAWSVLFAAFMQRDRRPNPSIAALVVSALALAATFIAPIAVAGPLATLLANERILVHVVLAISLVMGMRLAPSG